MLTSGQQLLGPGLEKTPDVKINNSLFLDDRDNKQAHAPHQFLTLQESRNCRLKRGELIPGERLLWVPNTEPCFEVFSKCYPAKRTRVWLGLKVMKTQRENMLGWTETSKKAPADSSRIDLFGLFFFFFYQELPCLDLWPKPKLSFKHGLKLCTWYKLIFKKRILTSHILRCLF